MLMITSSPAPDSASSVTSAWRLSCHRPMAPLADRLGIRKSRVGGWRILFTADREAKVIYILTVDTRGQVYKHS